MYTFISATTEAFFAIRKLNNSFSMYVLTPPHLNSPLQLVNLLRQVHQLLQVLMTIPYLNIHLALMITTRIPLATAYGHH